MRATFAWSLVVLGFAAGAHAQSDTQQPEQSPEDAAERERLEQEFGKALQKDEPAAVSAPARAATLRLIDLSLDLLAAGGTSSADEAELRRLEAGGHDPKNRGFTIQNVELTFAGAVDPYLRGDAHVVLQLDEEGESLVELEEAYLTTLDLPFNLQLKGGQFFTAFGRLNPMHPHAWDFVDQPVVSSRLLGADGLRNPGVQVSWLTPLPFYAELVASVQNAQGETATSFRSAPEETVAGRVLIEREVRSPQDLLYLLRLDTSFDTSEDVTLVPGVSAAFGPNASGRDTQTQIYGGDLYLKWRPLINDQGWPFAAWQTEAMLRRYDVPEGRILQDWGFYSQLVWGFMRPWVLGLRFDHAIGEDEVFADYDSRTDPLRDQRQRYSAELTYYPSEFSKLRLQYSYDRAGFLPDGDAHSVYLQAEILLGAHGAHKF